MSSDTGVRDADADIERESAQIADCMMRMMRAQHAIRAKVVTMEDTDAAATFLLIDLVKHGPRRASDLAGQYNADPSTVSRQVAALVKAGLVRRTADPDDGRASILVPTDKGVAAAKARVARRGRAVRPVVEDWPATDRADLLRLMHRFLDDLESHRDTIAAGYRSAAIPLSESASSNDHHR